MTDQTKQNKSFGAETRQVNVACHNVGHSQTGKDVDHGALRLACW